MKLIGYVKKYCQLSFEEKPFDVADSLVLSMLVYSNLEVVAPSIHDTKTKAFLIKDISDFDMSVITAGKTFLPLNAKLLKIIRHSRRYSEIGMRFLNKVFDTTLLNQFYACTFIIPGVGNYISFRGTDSTVLGWKEDLILSINKVIPSQLDALDYLKIVSSFIDGPIYVGGHSKGGNLALFSTILADRNIQDRLVKIYSFDGVGFVEDDVFKKESYLRIKDKVCFISPYDSYVGELFYNPENVLIVKSTAIAIFQHNPYSWKITNDGKLFELNQKSDGARARHLLSMKLNKILSKEDCSLIIQFLTLMFGGINKTIFYFFFSFNKIPSFFRALHSFNKEQRLQIKKSLKIINKAYVESVKEIKANKKGKKKNEH